MIRRALLIGCLSVLAFGCHGQTGFERPLSAKMGDPTEANAGRLLGTVRADATVLNWAGAPSLEGATARAFEASGRPACDEAKLGADGKFTLSGFAPSRSRLYVEVAVKNVRFRTVAPAPRDNKDYTVTLSAASTYLADKLRRGAVDLNLDFANLDLLRLDKATAAVEAAMTDDVRQRVLQRGKPDLNAHDFDHFAESHEPVRLAVYRLSAGAVRGWTPPPSQLPVFPSFAPASPAASPVASASPTPDPGGR